MADDRQESSNEDKVKGRLTFRQVLCENFLKDVF